MNTDTFIELLWDVSRAGHLLEEDLENFIQIFNTRLEMLNLVSDGSITPADVATYLEEEEMR